MLRQLERQFLRHRADVYAVTLLVVLTLALFIPLATNQITYSGDYAHYMLYAYYMQVGNWQEVPSHALLWSSIALIDQVTPLSFIASTVLSMVFYYALASVAIYVWLRRSVPKDAPVPRGRLILITLLLLVVAPASLVLFQSLRAYLMDVINASPHHNATSIVLRPFALVSLIVGASLFSPQTRWRTALMAGAVGLSLMAKPLIG